MAHPITRTTKFGYALLKTELETMATPEKAAREIFKAYEGDFWQKGAGSLLPPATGVHASVINPLLEKRFVFRNVIQECVNRVTQALLGRAPDWRFNDEKMPDELYQAVSELWDRQELAKKISTALNTRLVSSRGGLRIYVPLKYKRQNLQEDGTVGFTDIFEALNAIEVEYVPPSRARLLKDDSELFSVVKYDVRENWDTGSVASFIEFSFVDDSGLTYIGVAKENESGAAVPGELPIAGYIQSSGLDLNGFTTYYEFSGDPYITPAFYKNNQLLNLSLTCSGFALVDSGFREVFLTNVELETEEIVSEDGNTITVPKRLKRGGGAMQNLIGISTINEETGQETRMSPGVQSFDPVSIASFEQGKDLAYSACLEEVGQLYAKISGDAVASGESRIQAMKDFAIRVSKYKAEVDAIGSWVLSTSLALAAQLAGVNLDSRVVFDAKVQMTIDTEDRNSIIDQWKDGILSLETCRVLLGVEDPILESRLVQQETQMPIEEVSLDEAERRANLAASLSGQLPDNRIRKIAFGYTDADNEQVQAEFIEQSAFQFEAFSNPGEQQQNSDENQQQEAQTEESAS